MNISVAENCPANTASAWMNAEAVRMNGHDIVHGAMLGHVLLQDIQAEADAHGADFDPIAFKNVIRLIRDEKIQAHFIALKRDSAQPVFAGSTIEFPTTITLWEEDSFVHYPALYTEDLYVLPEISEKLKEEKKRNGIQDRVGLGTLFLKEKLSLQKKTRNKPDSDHSHNMPPRGFVAEYAIDNDCAKAWLQKVGGELDVSQDNNIFQFSKDSPHLRSEKTNSTIYVDYLGADHPDGTIFQPNVFAVTAEENNSTQALSVSFTGAISTFSGKPIIRVQLTSNGSLHNTNWIKTSLTNIFDVAQNEIIKRRWFPWATSHAKKAHNFLRIMKLHATHEPIIRKALKEMGAKPRKLGTKSMKPVVVDFNNNTTEILETEPCFPFTTLRTVPEKNKSEKTENAIIPNLQNFPIETQPASTSPHL
ncbi:MAG TPA: hypothetical protein DD400_05935 [Rhodospirillaceae bacterium]|nr:hypothetical protein [Rhodospirillaceae bacterium]